MPTDQAGLTECQTCHLPFDQREVMDRDGLPTETDYCSEECHQKAGL